MRQQEIYFEYYSLCTRGKATGHLNKYYIGEDYSSYLL